MSSPRKRSFQLWTSLDMLLLIDSFLGDNLIVGSWFNYARVCLVLEDKVDVSFQQDEFLDFLRFIERRLTSTINVVDDVTSIVKREGNFWKFYKIHVLNCLTWFLFLLSLSHSQGFSSMGHSLILSGEEIIKSAKAEFISLRFCISVLDSNFKGTVFWEIWERPMRKACNPFAC